jgi:hypothetical protein
MIANRSVPVNTVLPHLVYRNVAEAIVWLTKTFGFAEYYRYGEPDGQVNGAQMHLGNAWIMLQQEREHRASPARVGCRTQSLTVFVEDVETHFERAKASGRKDRGGTARDRIRRTAIRSRGSGRSSLAFFAARPRRVPGRMGSDTGKAANLRAAAPSGR